MRRGFRLWASLPLRAKGLVVVALPLGALLFATLVLYLVQQQQNQRQTAVQHTLRVREQIQTVQTLLLDAETGVRGFDLSERKDFLQPYSAAFDRLPQALARLEELTGDDPSQLARARRIRFQAGRKLELLAVIREGSLAPEGENMAAERAVIKDNDLMMELRADLDAMRRTEQSKLDRRLAELGTTRQNQDRLFAAVVALGLLGGIAAIILFTTGIARRVHRLEVNANKLAHGEPLLDRPEGSDEVGSLAEALAGASALLAARETELRDAKERAEQANWAKSDFLSRTSHELRTPLSAILGFAQYMQRRDLDEREREVMERIVGAGNHLASLLNDVLDIARIEAGGLAISVQTVDVEDAVSNAAELLQPLAREKDVSLAFNGVASDVHVAADPQRLKQILLNLLSNGIKYNRPGGSVVVSCERVNGRTARIGVLDSGAGIPPEKLERLFVPYDRLGAEESSVEGVGLGLPVAKSLVELMGGNISVSSEIGWGSTFAVDLPLADAGAAPGRSIPD